MKNPRNVVVKALFNADEFVALNDACIREDVSHSWLLRKLAMDFVRQRQSTEAASPEKCAGAGQKLAMPSANSRVNYGVAPVRLRI
ncbi:MAG: hypothetical protein ACXV99_12730 [Candidatus Angelobacter sp.]